MSALNQNSGREPDLPFDILLVTGYDAPYGWKEITLGNRNAYILDSYYCGPCADAILKQLDKFKREILP
jgi:hypothetical protein